MLHGVLPSVGNYSSPIIDHVESGLCALDLDFVI